ncbi:MAG: YihY family inner membrane protein [Verrucomicrobia bacterium]|nr:YihY family inner membrane protein [Verrucomicrobiota bacterium]
MANDSLAKLKKIHADAQVVLTDQEAQVRDENQLSPLQKFLHFWLLVSRSFVRNRCPVRASALAYASLLALVPMLAVVAGISATFLKKEGEKPIEAFIEKFVASVTPATRADTNAPAPGGSVDSKSTVPADPQNATTRKQIVRSINDFIGNVRSGALGVTGMIALVFMAITMLGRVEDTFNDIWGVTRGRNWYARIVQYWAALTLGPLLLMVALALTSGPQLQTVQAVLAELPLGLGRLVEFAIKFLLPFVILSVAFALFYELMPNTKVRWEAALAGGIVGGCLWQLNNLISVLYVSRVVTNSKIYGSLGMVPVFMIGLYFSWMILLFGAQVAYAYQNRRTYFQERQVEAVHQLGREFVAVRLMTLIAQSFQHGQKPPTVAELSQTLAVPSKLAGQLLRVLVQARLLAETTNSDTGYTPARPLNQITFHDILQALRVGQGQELATLDDAARQVVQSELARIRSAEEGAAKTVTLEALRARLDDTPASAVPTDS